MCTTEGKPPRRCYACSGFEHLSRNCPLRSRQQPVQLAESKPKSSNAVLSAGTGAPQLFSEAVIDGVLIRDALVDTGSAFSRVSSALYHRLPSRPLIDQLDYELGTRYRRSRRRECRSQRLYRRTSANRRNRGRESAAGRFKSFISLLI